MGDIQGLIDLAPEDLDEEEAMRLTQRMMSGRFTLNDMYKQMEMMSKVGTIDKLMSFLPGNMLGGLGGMSKTQKQQMQSINLNIQNLLKVKKFIFIEAHLL